MKIEHSWTMEGAPCSNKASLFFKPYVHSFLKKTGPAGTGKTESVKALGHQLGRFVLVFNCDETFDFQVQCFFSFGYTTFQYIDKLASCSAHYLCRNTMA